MGRNRENRMISFNTQVRVGGMYYNPNYATVEEYARVGIYAWCGRYQVKEAIRLRMRMLNVNPSMRSAKGALGLRPLRRCAVFATVWSCIRRQPRQEVPDLVVDEEPAQQPP